MSRVTTVLALVAGVLIVPALHFGFTETNTDGHIQVFDAPVDALSVQFPQETNETAVRYHDGTRWSAWTALAIENEQDPTLRESNLVMLPRGVTRVAFRDDPANFVLHPIRVSAEPSSALVAATQELRELPILSRKQWGADESLTTTDAPEPSSTDHDQGEGSSGQPSQRVQDCLDMQTNYPSEFKVSRTETTANDGKRLRWAWQYSPSVELLVVHHTAVAVGDDERSGVERVRALYQYHAQNRGWGDIGYHYLVDEDGRIYEGKAGGKYVVGGHAYCNNIGTIGIALLGNFEVEKPTQAQLQGLEKLLAKLADDYSIDLDDTVRFHGASEKTVVGHRDLLSTDCPGYYVYGALSQIRTNAANGDFTKKIALPAGAVKTPSSRKPSSSGQAASKRSSGPLPQFVTGISAIGETTLTGPPGSQLVLSVRYRASGTVARRGSEAGKIERSDDSIGVWQDNGEGFQRLRDSLTLPSTVPANGTVAIRLKIQFPLQADTYELRIGQETFTLVSKGRRLPTPRGQTTPAAALPSGPRPRSLSSRAYSSVAPLPTRPASSARPVTTGPIRTTATKVELDKDVIRIRLNAIASNVTLSLPTGSRINTQERAGSVFFFKDGNDCVAAVGQQRLAEGIVRADAKDGIVTVLTGSNSRYRGVIECRVIDDVLVFINELPLESYMLGLAEEPDTEPYEKQRAFAIAARSYAAFYMQEANRKFPGKPYDGSDSPAEFQVYAGVNFEDKHPNWLRAVSDTANEVLTADGDLLKPPYFSASDGRTLSPSEAGWNTFPHPEIFTSKPDPWCAGQTRRGHGVGMSGCGAEAQANEGKTAEDILGYYYAGARIAKID